MVARTESLWDRFAAIEPGLMRLTSAMRAVLGAAATLAVLTALHGSDTALLAGGFTAMVTSLAIGDLPPRNQLITLGLGAPLSLAALTAGAVLTPYPTAAKMAFLLVIYLAVQARRFGARGLGLGVFGFMAFFLSQFAQARVVQLPQLGAAVLIAFGAVATVWYCAGPRTMYGALTRLRRAFDGRLHAVLRDTASVIAAGQEVHTRSRALERRLDTDPEKAQHGPFGGPIAHGYLTLSLIIPMFGDLLEISGISMSVNYGLEKVRFPSPVPVGAKIRLHGVVDSVDEVKGNGVQMALTFTVEVEGHEKPACVARAVYRHYA
ncbi:MaoC family dehydratase [Streptomyces tendae]